MYTEIHVFPALFVQERSDKDSVVQRHSTGEYECKNEGKYLYSLCLLKVKIQEYWRNWGFGNITYVTVMVYFAYFESFIVYGNTHRPCYVSKGLITAAFGSCERFHIRA